MTNAATLAELRALNAKFIHNFVTNDVASHDAILHRAFTYVSSAGAWQDRASYLSRWSTGFSGSSSDGTIGVPAPFAAPVPLLSCILRGAGCLSRARP